MTTTRRFFFKNRTDESVIEWWVASLSSGAFGYIPSCALNNRLFIDKFGFDWPFLAPDPRACQHCQEHYLSIQLEKKCWCCFHRLGLYRMQYLYSIFVWSTLCTLFFFSNADCVFHCGFTMTQMTKACRNFSKGTFLSEHIIGWVLIGFKLR